MKNSIRTYLATLVATVFTILENMIAKNPAQIIAALAKIEAKIEAAIRKGSNDLSKLKSTQDNIATTIAAKNAELDTAYKLLNTVSGLVK